MLSTCPGEAVAGLLSRVVAAPHEVCAVTVVTPFLDEQGANLLSRVAQACARRNERLRVATWPDTPPRVVACLPEYPRARAFGVAGLHAKAYAVLSRDAARTSEVIITSANLIQFGLTRNAELGIHLASADAVVQRIVRGVLEFPTRSAWSGFSRG